ncbi:tetratricopeptide repeat protein [Ideonella sp. 4Y11]|uniref:Tetratricopeptide repeat protein n=1 Tax=Ideonella aquatica TaxID=2824119 RepID=A0A941BME8_9BURK|nr:tetratricopeptide repeat protein [Ideonella aquatica]MBQ0960764.1 tetratricopeptide repeat protein [Ideonella aquatica]
MLASAGDESRFWALLARGRAEDLLELEAEPVQSYAQAEQILTRWTGATTAHRLWLASSRLLTGRRVDTPEESRSRLDSLKRQLAGVDDPLLACDVKESELDILIDIGSLDEAWLVAEDWERCARALNEPFKEAWAISMFGTIASKGHGRSRVDPDEYFARALAVVGERPARTLRNALLYQRADALRLVGRWDEAADHLRASIALGREVGDEAAIAAGSAGLAEILLEQNRPAEALPWIREARAILEPRDGGFRMVNVATLLVWVYTQLKHPELPAAMALARRYDTDTSPGPHRAYLARVLAAAHASTGRFKEAYAELKRAEALDDRRRRFAAEVQNLRLQARYAAAQRDAENADLRHQSETARLALVA